MVYRVATRWKPLNVRVRPGLGYRVVHQLARGSIVAVLETVRAEGRTWHRVRRGWAVGMYLEPVPRQPFSEDPPRELPAFLAFDPLDPTLLAQRMRRLRREREYAEERFVTYSQGAAQHGSRIYEMDDESERARQIEDVGRLFSGAPTPGITAQENAHNSQIRREMEENAQEWRSEIQRLDGRIEDTRRALERVGSAGSGRL